MLSSGLGAATSCSPLPRTPFRSSCRNVTDNELHSGDCERAPDKVRVFGLRNCAIKLISATMNRAVRP
eukprot:1077276-Pyramimonas_sp.AAC.1